MAKEKMKKVIADVTVEEIYFAETECPYCGYGNVTQEIEMDNVTITEQCFKCGKKYKVKIPKDSF